MKNEGEGASPFCDDRELAEAALEGDPRAVGEVKAMVDGGKMRGMLMNRGASATEADEIVGDLLGDCFGGERARGGMFRLLGNFSGKGALGGYLNRAALNRLIDLKRNKRVDVPIKEQAGDEEEGVVLEAGQQVESEDAVMELLQSAVMEAFAAVDQEKFVLFRMRKSYGIPQKRIAEMWGWSEFKVSRAFSKLLEELKENVMSAVRRRDPWLELEWEDFLAMCGDSVDLFDY